MSATTSSGRQASWKRFRGYGSSGHRSGCGQFRWSMTVLKASRGITVHTYCSDAVMLRLIGSRARHIEITRYVCCVQSLIVCLGLPFDYYVLSTTWRKAFPSGSLEDPWHVVHVSPRVAVLRSSPLLQRWAYSCPVHNHSDGMT